MAPFDYVRERSKVSLVSACVAFPVSLATGMVLPGLMDGAPKLAVSFVAGVVISTILNFGLLDAANWLIERPTRVRARMMRARRTGRRSGHSAA
jgi:hypothetical protein